jgi:hypothetical protein
VRPARGIGPSVVAAPRSSRARRISIQAVVQLVHGLGILVVIEVLAVDVGVCALAGGGWCVVTANRRRGRECWCEQSVDGEVDGAVDDGAAGGAAARPCRRLRGRPRGLAGVTRLCATSSLAARRHLWGMRIRLGQPRPVPWAFVLPAEGAILRGDARLRGTVQPFCHDPTRRTRIHRTASMPGGSRAAGGAAHVFEIVAMLLRFSSSPVVTRSGCRGGGGGSTSQGPGNSASSTPS